MKIKGKNVKKVGDVVYGPELIDRGDGEIHGFYAKAVLDFQEFNELCPPPTPPVTAFGKDGKKTYDENSPKHKDNLRRHDRQYHGYYILKTLAPTELDLTDEGVSFDDPETWDKVDDVLKDLLGHFEYARLMRFVDAANSIDPDKMAANLETFFQEAARSEDEPQPSNDHSGDQESSNSGEPANGGTSDRGKSGQS